MIHCTHCLHPITAVESWTLQQQRFETYLHTDTGSPYCDTAGFERASDNGFHKHFKQARPLLNEVTLRNIRELAPM
jgi:hypothetical protein